jgi:hypothetical protein
LANAIIVIGGPSRAGKSTLAKAVADRHGLSVLAWDMLLFGLHYGAPKFGVDAVGLTADNKALTWPVWQEMLVHAPVVSRPTIAEGGPFVLSDFQNSERLRGKIVTYCYLGYADTTPELKLAEVRRASQSQPDWTNHHSDAWLTAFLEGQIAYSRLCREQVAQAEGATFGAGCQYFDTGADFGGILRRAAAWLGNWV